MHAALGMAVGATGAYLLDKSGYPYSAFFFGGCLVGSIFPDIDSKYSTIGNIILGIPLIINKIFGHRNFIHTPACILLISIPVL